MHCRKKNLHALHSAYLQNVRRLFFKPFILHRRNAPYEAQRALRVLPSRRMSSDSRRILKLSRLKSHRYQVAGIFQIPVRQYTKKVVHRVSYIRTICNSTDHVKIFVARRMWECSVTRDFAVAISFFFSPFRLPHREKTFAVPTRTKSAA